MLRRVGENRFRGDVEKRGEFLVGESDGAALIENEHSFRHGLEHCFYTVLAIGQEFARGDEALLVLLQCVDAIFRQFDKAVETLHEITELAGGSDFKPFELLAVEKALHFRVGITDRPHLETQQQIEQWYEKEYRQGNHGEEWQLRHADAACWPHVAEAHKTAQVAVGEQWRVKFYDAAFVGREFPLCFAQPGGRFNRHERRWDDDAVRSNFVDRDAARIDDCNVREAFL